MSDSGRAQQAGRGMSARGVAVRLAIAAGLATAYALSIALERSELPGVSPCLFVNVTGLDCPSCGLTRAFVAISHGHAAEAWRLNALAIPVYVLGLVLAPVLAWEALVRRDVVDRFLRRHARAAIAVVVLAVAARYAALFLA